MNDFDEDKIREARERLRKERLRNKPTVSAWLFLLLMVVSVIGVIHNYYLIKENIVLKQNIQSYKNLTTISQPINISSNDCQSEFDKCVEVARGLYNLNQEGVCLK